MHFLRDDHLDVEPTRIWALFEFVWRDGAIGEIDALALAAKGFYLLVITKRPCRVAGDSGTGPGSTQDFASPTTVQSTSLASGMASLGALETHDV